MRNERGLAGIEFALVASILCILVLNGIDVARYAWIRMQVENAAHLGAQAAWKTCDPNKLPIVPNCSDMPTKVLAAVQSTSLGNKVTLQGVPTEGYYCVDAVEGLKLVGSATNPPATCASTGKPDLLPGDYVKVDVTFTYAPLFNDLTIAKLFNSSVTKTARVRLQ